MKNHFKILSNSNTFLKNSISDLGTSSMHHKIGNFHKCLFFIFSCKKQSRLYHYFIISNFISSEVAIDVFFNTFGLLNDHNNLGRLNILCNVCYSTPNSIAHQLYEGELCVVFQCISYHYCKSKE